MHAALLPLIAAAMAAGPHWKPNDQALKAYDRGAEALEAGRLEQAQRKLGESLAQDPDCGACSHALAVTLLRLDDAEEAVERLQELARQHPHRAEVMVSLADAAFGSQDFDLSIEAASIALVLDATRWEALEAMIRACLRTGDLATARTWMDSASGAHPDDRLACLELDLRVEEGDTAGAETSMQKCERSADDALIAHARSRVAAATGDYTSLSEQASQSGRSDVQRLSDALLAFEQGDHRRAVRLLEIVLEAQPSNAEAALFLGLSEHRLGRDERAIVTLTRAFEGEAWIEVGRDGSYAGVVTAGGARVFEERLRQGVGLLVLLQVERGLLADASHSLDRAKAELGGCAEIDAGRVALLAARGEPTAAAISATRALGSWPGVPLLDDTVRELLLNHPQARTDELLEAALTAGLAEGGYWRAIALRDGGQPDACGDTLDAVMPLVDELNRETITTLAWACAVEAGRLEQADTHRAVLLANGLNPDLDVSLNHARLAIASGQHASARALLDQLDIVRPDRLAYARSLRVLVAVGLEQLDHALALQREAPVSAEVGFELALALLRAERLVEAAPVLSASCGGLDDPAQRARCQTIEGEVAGVLEDAR